MNDNKDIDNGAEELRKCEEKFLKAFLASPDGVAISSLADSRIKEANEVLSGFMGYAREDFIDRSALDMGIWLNPDDRNKYILYLGERGEVTDLETTFRHRDGRAIPVLISGQIVDFRGEPYIVSFIRDISERRIAEEALQTSEAHYRATLDSLSDAIHVVDRDMRILLFNVTFGKWCDALGLDTAHLVGKKVRDAFPFLPDHVFDEGERVFRTGQTMISEIALSVRGQERITETRRIPLVHAGEVVRLVTVIRDITERKKAEEALRTSEAHYRATLDSIGDSVHVLDRDFKIILFNAAAIQSSSDIGINAADVIGTNLFDAFPFIPDYFREELTSVFETGQALFREHSLVLNDVQRVSEVRIIPLKEGDTVARVVSVIRDITSRKAQEKALKESEMKYRTLTNNIPDIICSIDGAGRLLAMNETSAQLTGFGIPEVMGSSFMEYIHPKDRALVHDNFVNGIKEKREYTRGLQFRLVKKSGDIIWVDLNSHRRFDENGDFIQEDAILRDVTERKQAEEERAILARRVEERTAELSAANAELSRAVRAKDEFLASMSHELRTPLSSILSISESLDEEVYGPLSERQRKSVKSVTESGQHLLSLINDILDLSKIEAGKIILELAPVNVEDLCQASMRLARSQAFKKKLSLSLTVDSQVATLMADERYLKQILVNLLGNAVKFTPEGGKMGLEVKGDAEGQLVCFTVWDNGIGIPAEKQPLLFKPFTQLDSSLSRQYGGTGLGLALVARLTEMHGGSVSLESGPEKGSRFTVTLPWSPSLHALDEEPCDDIPAVEARRGATASIRQALVVEDSQGDAEQIARYLIELGVNPVIQKEGMNVIDRALEIKPDLIILDIMLPDIDGWEVLRALKADPRTGSIPVVISSVIDERGAGRDMGADDYIVKPISRDQLKKVLCTVLKGKEEGVRAMVIASDLQGGGYQARGGPLVLLADDNETTISIISEYLYAHGFRVIVARNGGEACERARESHPDIILMDIQMPGVDGLEAMRAIRAEEDRKLREVPIIALTALAMVGDRERCLGAGADEYLSKPVGLKRLVKAIDHVIALKALQEPGAPEKV
jgi:PAS domain S-box-containing protein